MVFVAKDIVEKDFLTFRRDVNALEAARQMKSRRHGFAIIIDEDGNPEGIVTEWDYLSKIVAEAKDSAKVRLEDIMSTDLVFVKGEDGLDHVAEVMTEKGIRRVLVEDRGKVLGVITSRTMLSRLKEYVDRISTQIARLLTPRY